MDAGIIDTINRRDVAFVAARLDALDLPYYRGSCSPRLPWYRAPIADTLMSEDDSTRSDRAWLIGRLASGVPGIAFDGEPAGGDWDNLYGHFRDAISARRDTETPQGEAAEDRRVGVV